MPSFFIELAGEQFKRTYLLYVIEVCHKEDRYYYVGQTGDKNYRTARPAFRRLSGHLEDIGKSTQNQVYRYIAVKILGYTEAEKQETFDEKIKQGVEDFLVSSTIRMSIYKVQLFDPSISHSEHQTNVRRVASLENHVIKAFANSGKLLINKTNIEPTDLCPYPDLLAQIKLEFGIH
jgi:hypothetical protein